MSAIHEFLGVIVNILSISIISGMIMFAIWSVWIAYKERDYVICALQSFFLLCLIVVVLYTATGAVK